MKQTAVEWLEEQISMGLADIETIKQAKAMEKDQKVEFGKRCFYEGFEKAENGDANCFTAWREAVDKLLPFK